MKTLAVTHPNTLRVMALVRRSVDGKIENHFVNYHFRGIETGAPYVTIRDIENGSKFAVYNHKDLISITFLAAHIKDLGVMVKAEAVKDETISVMASLENDGKVFVVRKPIVFAHYDGVNLKFIGKAVNWNWPMNVTKLSVAIDECIQIEHCEA